MDESRPLYDQDINSIVLWMPNWIGDVVLTLPALQSLRRAYPKARITAVVKPPSNELLLGHPAINTVLPLPSGSESGLWKRIKFARSLQKYQFDVGIVIPNSFGSAFLLSLTGAKYRLGYNTDARDIFLTHPIETNAHLKKSQYRVEYFFKIFSPLKLDFPDTVFNPVVKQEGDLSVREALLNIGLDEDEEFITLHPGTSKVERSWHVERFGILCQKIFKADGKKLVLLGTKSEEELLNRIKSYCPPGKVKVTPVMNLRVLAGVLKKSRLFVGNDSGMMHLAAMVGTPVVGIFGPGNPDTTGPYMPPENCEILTQNYSCSPCRQRFFKECKPSPHNKPYCLEDITVKNVYEAIHRLMRRA
ncbi:MAG: lipopolysaccharide heptosyltransferase II [Nitrospina sp.]|jgi:heptosyltransferase II|nr:lipopolysaccharide heptosyltransferase II [Nitrospina sp.]